MSTQSANTETTSTDASKPSSFTNIKVVSHPLIAARLSALRCHDLPSKDFRDGIKAISSMIVYEAARDLPLHPVPDLQSPISSFTGCVVPLRVGLVPILRAGIGMTDAALDHFQDASVLHLGLFREKTSLQVIEYYSKLPAKVNVDVVYLLDPMIATGHTATSALHTLQEWGIPLANVKLLSVLCSKTGVEQVAKDFPEVEIWTAGIDADLTKEGYISPGLGDAGDRLFNTLHNEDGK